MIFVSWNIKLWENKFICLANWNSGYHKSCSLAKTHAAGRANDRVMDAIVMEFKVDHRLNNVQRYFCGMYGMS